MKKMVPKNQGGGMHVGVENRVGMSSFVFTSNWMDWKISPPVISPSNSLSLAALTNTRKNGGGKEKWQYHNFSPGSYTQASVLAPLRPTNLNPNFRNEGSSGFL